MSILLAVDLGLKCGLALYGADGRLRWYRSTNFGTTARLRRGVRSVLNALPDLTHLIVEGGGLLAEIWVKEAERRGVAVQLVSAEKWRGDLLYAREQRSGPQAKQKAEVMARRVIAWSKAPKPTALRHDTAEAILIGLWGVLELGWLGELPQEVKRS